MRTLQSRINAGFILISTITAIVTGGVSILLSIQYTENEAKEKLRLMVSTYSEEMERNLGKIKLHADVIESLAITIWEDNPSEPEAIKKQRLAKYMLNYANKAKTNSLWIVFNPDATPPPYVFSLYDSTEKNNYTFEKDYNILTIDTTQNDIKWWNNAERYGESWTDPYYWKPWNKNIISYARKFTINNKFMAVLGSDLFFDKMKKKIAAATSFDSGYFWIVNSNYTMILHPTLKNLDVRLVNNGKVIDQIRKQNKQEGTTTYDYQGSQKMLAYKKLSNDWTLCMSVPNSEVFKHQRTITLIIIGLTILLSGLAVFVSKNLSRSIANPLTSFIAIFKRGAEGDLSVRTTTSTTTNEIAELSHSFNHFISRMQWQVEELEETKVSLTSAMQRAEESNRLKSAFLSNISHEIRTPLNAVIGFTELIKRETLSDEDKKRFSELIVKNAFALLHTMDDVILSSKLESGTLRPNMVRVSVDDILNIALEAYSKHRGTYSLSPNTELSIITNDAHKTAYISTDIALLNEIISQLLENSIKFTEQGYIKVGALVSSLSVVFYIEDTGIGIEPDQKEKIFEVFYKVNGDESRLLGGSGLGLSIALKAANLLGANIWLESEPRKKTTFFVGFPLIS